MQIIKRNGTTESYDREKIAVAIRKSFISTQKEITDEAVYTIVDEVEQFLRKSHVPSSYVPLRPECVLHYDLLRFDAEIVPLHLLWCRQLHLLFLFGY